MTSSHIIVLGDPSNHRPDYTWNPQWIFPCESPWGILEKFKLANNANVTDIFNTLGTEYVDSLKMRTSWSKKLRNLTTLEGFSDQKAHKILGNSFVSNTKNIMTRMISVLPHFLIGQNQKLIRENVAFCGKCMQWGYHSVLHQIKLFHICPFHPDQNLETKCLDCSREIPYVLSNTHTESPFRCLCGKNMTNLPKHGEFYFDIWKKAKGLKIQLLEIKKWISLTPEQLERLERIYFHRNDDLDNRPNTLLYFLQFVEPSTKENWPTIQYNVMRSASYIVTLHGEQERKFLANPEYGGFKSFFQRQHFVYQVLYNCSLQVFKSIDRHLRKTVFKDHCNCIRYFHKDVQNHEEVCAYALTYILWKQHIEQINNYWDVVNRRRIGLRKMGVNFYSKQDSHYLNRIFERWERIQGDVAHTGWTTSCWIFTKLMAFLVLNHLKNWAEVVPEFARKRILDPVISFDYKNLPFYIIFFPKVKGESAEFHYWNNTVSYQTALKQANLTCPFVKARSHKG
ncbi:hypothetical protein [Aneurinibacillus uraniidurans]|uniref:hypothetical protein n=1 Tax=Aneurinibacillus uraniidurans TaxID=2966586 RepID=UPI00234A5AEF|nr:hypothetical protein [Aneurinibacillus sp. B1]WCN36212.1 hypothetical protein PO771_09925 [Aneurinibacillus sp. B1]